MMNSESLRNCGALLAEKKLKIATVESATAGRLAYEISRLEQSGQILIGGIVSYDAVVKEGLLKLSKAVVEKYTPESAEVTEMMAYAVKDVMAANMYVAVTGLTTPGGSETAEKPVGTIFANILFGGSSFPLRKEFKGDAEQIVTAAIDWIAGEILKILNQ